MQERGFTLIELLLSVALSTLMLVSAMAILASLGPAAYKPGALLEQSASAGSGKTTGGASEISTPSLRAAAVDAWIGVLRADLLHAGRVDTGHANTLHIRGHGALEASKRGRTHRPVRVTYTVEKNHGRRWLVRRQVALDVRTNANVQRDLVCRGVHRFELTRMSFGAKGASSVGTTQAEPSAGGAMVDRGEGGASIGSPDAQKAGHKGDESTSPEKNSDPSPPGEAGEDRNEHERSGKTVVTDRVSHGLTFYEKYKPDKQQATKANRTSSPDESAKSAPAVSGPARSEPKTDRRHAQAPADQSRRGRELSHRGTVWRLLIWLRDQRQPTHERIVAVE
jgi:prepilin-type N-terminal cleavage/methylation domain-containing protein